MRHQNDHRKLGRHTSHRRALLRNLATSLVLSERIETTLPKAKELRRVADHLITLAKDGSLHARRQAASYLMVPGAVAKLFNGLGARFNDRQGGYTRIYQLGFRRGDSAQMCTIEYLGYQLPEPKKQEDGEKAEKKVKKEAAPIAAKPAKEKKAKPEKKETKKAAAPKAEKKDSKKEKSADKKEGGLKGIFGKKKK